MSADYTARAWQSILSLLIYSSFLLMVAHGLTCDFENPCNVGSPSECASHIADSCPHGYVLNACDCCDCGKGPDELCGGQDNLEGICGHGLMCVVSIPPDLPDYIDASQLPGLCKPETPQPPTTPSQTPSTVTPTTDCDPTDDPTVDEMSGSSSATQEIPEGCREKCSVQFCSGSRHRLCSAQELAYSSVQNRDSCQHTSCRACYLLVDCSALCSRCSEPPKKKCLRQYYECIKEQYLHTTVSQILLTLDDPKAKTTPGRIICYVPEVEEESPH